MTQFRFWPLLVMLALLIFSTNAKATHLYGGELLYTHLSGNNYKITLTLYGDCSGEFFFRLPNASPGIEVYKGETFVESIRLQEDIPLRKEVSPVCPEDSNNTSCRSVSANALPGVTRFIYTGMLSLPPSTDWRLVFEGAMNNNSSAGRSNSITNVVINNNGQLMYLVATLNNMNGPNNSPQYSSIPTPFYCINRAQQYNQGAVDADGDSLYFSMIPALSRGTPSQYISPYSGAMPLAVQDGSFEFNGNSGQLSFLPNLIQRSLVVSRVDEYKDGVLMGSSMREMTFIVLNNCNNTPPTGAIDTATIEGGGVIGKEINVCVNTPQLTLAITGKDADTNNVTVSLEGIPEGATAQIADNGTKNPVVYLTWKTLNQPLGIYNIFITYTDDACPLLSSQTIAYTIRIVKPNTISHEVIRPTNCLFRQLVQFNITDGVLPRFVTITNMNGDILREYEDTTGIIIDSFRRGKYKLYAESRSLECKTEYEFIVEDYGTFPIPLIFQDKDVCLNDPVDTIKITPVQGAVINWYDISGKPLDGLPIYATSMTKKYEWLVTQQFDTCETAPDTFSIEVHELPAIAIQNKNERLCNGDSVQLKATGGIKYNWQPDKWITQNDSIAFAWVRQPTTYVVTAYNEYNCTTVDSILLDNLDACCKFSYPDAFTPNGDGLNDGWKPITIAHADFYTLSIYNRWGQRVFLSFDQDERWDGTFNGKPCDMGTYYYYLRAKCILGRQEMTEGSIILLR